MILVLSAKLDPLATIEYISKWYGSQIIFQALQAEKLFEAVIYVIRVLQRMFLYARFNVSFCA